MTSKNISITNDVYHDLVKLKRADESFSDIIKRLVKDSRKNPLQFFGILKDVPDEVLDSFEDAIKDMKDKGSKKADEKIHQDWS